MATLVCACGGPPRAQTAPTHSRAPAPTPTPAPRTKELAPPPSDPDRAKSVSSATEKAYRTLGGGPLAEVELAKRQTRLPAVKLGTGHSSSGLPADLIRREIRRLLRRFRTCYDTADSAPSYDLSARMRIAFMINQRGEVARSEVEGMEPEIARCVEGLLESMRFPPPEGGGVVHVRYPMLFQTPGKRNP